MTSNTYLTEAAFDLLTASHLYVAWLGSDKDLFYTMQHFTLKAKL
jgi:hypothetical protein